MDTYRTYEQVELFISLVVQKNGNAIAIIARKNNVLNLIYLWEDRLISFKLLFKTLREFLNKFAENCFTTQPRQKFINCYYFTNNNMASIELKKFNVQISNIEIFSQSYETLCDKETALNLMLAAINDNEFQVSKNIDFSKIKEEFDSVKFEEDKIISPTLLALILSLGEIIYRESTEQMPFIITAQSNAGLAKVFEELGY